MNSQPFSHYILLLLGVYQILFGFFGFYVLIEMYYSSFFVDAFLTSIITVSFYLLSILAGVLLISNKSFKLSYLNQALQTVQFYIAGIGFFYSAGSHLGVGIAVRETVELFHEFSAIHVACYIRIGAESTDTYILLNLMAVLMIMLLMKIESISKKHLN